MKKTLSLASALLFAGAVGTAFSQTGASTPSLPTHPIARATPMKAMVKTRHPLVDKITANVESQNERMIAGVKDQKLTENQAEAFHAKLMSIMVAVQNDLKNKGRGDLTKGQFKQLNQLLDQIAKGIQDEMTPAASGTPAVK